MKNRTFAGWKSLIISLMLLHICMPVWAETYVYSSDQAPAVYFECEDFDGEIPPALSGVFDGCLQEGDEILCGTRRASKYYSERETAMERMRCWRFAVERRSCCWAPKRETVSGAVRWRQTVSFRWGRSLM